MKLIRAHYGSRNFDFEAYGLTMTEARAALIETLRKHAAQYHTDPAWVTDCIAEIDDDTGSFSEVEPGAGYRDGEKIFGGQPQ